MVVKKNKKDQKLSEAKLMLKTLAGLLKTQPNLTDRSKGYIRAAEDWLKENHDPMDNLR